MKNPISVAGDFLFKAMKESSSADDARETAGLLFNYFTLLAIAHAVNKIFYPPFTPQGIAFMAACFFAREICHKAMFSGIVMGTAEKTATVATGALAWCASFFGKDHQVRMALPTFSPVLELVKGYPAFYITPKLKDGWKGLKELCSS